jgi:hypothetical protein
MQIKPKNVGHRSQRQQTSQFTQKLEDFMDEEDMGAFGFAPQVLRTSHNFSKDTETDARKRKLQREEPLLAHAIINNILQPARETIGKKMLLRRLWCLCLTLKAGATTRSIMLFILKSLSLQLRLDTRC